MVTYQNLQEALKKTVGWERKLNDLYDVAKFGVKNADSKELVSFLSERQIANLEVIERVDVKKFGPDAYIQFAGDIREDELIPSQEIHQDSTPEHILNVIFEFEDKLMNFYGMIADNVSNESQRDLFNSLKLFKEEQIKRIKNFVRVD